MAFILFYHTAASKYMIWHCGARGFIGKILLQTIYGLIFLISIIT